MTAGLHWRTAALTDVGRKRKINEDSHLCRPEAGLWVVADGMGGHAAGDVASQCIVSHLNQIKPSLRFADFVDQVEDGLMDVNRYLRDYSQKQLQGHTMGSTVVSLLVHERLGVCLWAGDSRLYRSRNGCFERISRDHSAVQEMIDRGLLSEADAEAHPRSNVITRAVGGMEDLRVDCTVFDVQPGDSYLLCSDGLYNEVPRDQLAEWLAGDDEAQAAQQMIQQALDNGGRDNVSLIVVKA